MFAGNPFAGAAFAWAETATAGATQGLLISDGSPESGAAISADSPEAGTDISGDTPESGTEIGS